MHIIPLIPKNVRDCHEDSACVLVDDGLERMPNSVYDPYASSEEEMLLAVELIQRAHERGINVALGDLGIQAVMLDVPAQQTTELSFGPEPLSTVA